MQSLGQGYEQKQSPKFAFTNVTSPADPADVSPPHYQENFQYLTDQIQSLQEIIRTFEQQVFAKLNAQLPGQIMDSTFHSAKSDKISTHEHLCEVWRQKVFTLLVQKKQQDVLSHQQSREQRLEVQSLRQSNAELDNQLKISNLKLHESAQQVKALQIEVDSKAKQLARAQNQHEALQSTKRKAEAQMNEVRKHLNQINYVHQTQLSQIQQELVSVISSKTQQIRQLEQIVSVYHKTNSSVSGKLFKQIREQDTENTRLVQEIKGLRQKLDLQEEVRQSVDGIKE